MAKYNFDEKETAEWLRKLPKKPVAVKVIFKTTDGSILLVKPNYKDTWQFPGGGVEAVESPKSAAVREVTEEIGLTISPDRLKLLDLVFLKERDEIILIYEYTQPIDQDQTLSIQEEELDGYKFEDVSDVLAQIGSYYDSFWSSYLSSKV